MFERRISFVFLKSKNKKALFGTLRSQLRMFLKYPEEYIMKMLEMISDEMPLHAAVSAGYFQTHKCFPEKISEFMGKLREKTEKNFIDELSSEKPDTQRCAELHAAFCYLDPEHKGAVLPQAVGSLDDRQRESLFYEVGKCINAVHDISQEERDLLDPILRYFSVHYSEDINRNFLKENEGNFSSLVPDNSTIGELLSFAVKNNYFIYFRLLYSMFPGWHVNQTQFTSEDFIDMGFSCTDVPEHLLMISYAGLQLAKEGHSYFSNDQLEKWLKKVNSFGNKDIEQVVSFLYYSYCIESDPYNAEKFVRSMPFYKQDDLFSETLLSHTEPIGAAVIRSCTDILLKENFLVTGEYLKKAGDNNKYKFENELLYIKKDENVSADHSSFFSRAAWQLSADEILNIYFNSYIRAEMHLNDFGKIISKYYDPAELNRELRKYTFSGELHLNRFEYPEGMKGIGYVETENINQYSPAYYSVYIFQLAQHINIRYLCLPYRSREIENNFLKRTLKIKLNSFEMISTIYDNVRSFIFFDDYNKLPDSSNRNVIKYYSENTDIFRMLTGYSNLSCFLQFMNNPEWLKRRSENGFDINDNNCSERKTRFDFNDAEIIAEGMDLNLVCKEREKVNDRFCEILNKISSSGKADKEDIRFVIYHSLTLQMTRRSLKILSDILKSPKRQYDIRQLFDTLYSNEFYNPIYSGTFKNKVMFSDTESFETVQKDPILNDFFTGHYEIDSPNDTCTDVSEEDEKAHIIFKTVEKMIKESRLNKIYDYLVKMFDPIDVKFLNERFNAFFSVKKNPVYELTMNMIVRHCTSNMIKKIYMETELRFNTSLNKLLKTASLNNKLDDLIYELRDDNIIVTYFKSQDGTVQKSSNNVYAERFCFMENDDMAFDEKNRTLVIKGRIAGYDLKNDCILLKFLSQKNDQVTNSILQSIEKIMSLLHS